MNRDAAVAEATPRLLPPAAIGDLAHDLRGSIHVIRGHAELLRAEAADVQSHESAAYIVDASHRLGGLCDDVIDLLRLPAVAPGEPVVLALEDLMQSLSLLALDRGIQLRIVEPEREEESVRVNPCVRRVVAHVLERAVCTALSDATIATAYRPSREAYAIAVSPVSGDIVESDGVVAVAAELLAFHGGRMSVSGGKLEILVPIVGETS
jgi:signal transduction histidine kinase